MGKSWRGPSQEWRNRISSWEGSSMYKPAPDTGKVNNSFEKEAQGFINTLPISIRGALSDEALNALYSYSYNVGVGNFKRRVLPTLQNYVLGKATAQDVANHMYGTNDSKYRGLQNRRAYEKEAFLRGVNSPSNTNISTRSNTPYTPLAAPNTPTLAKISSFSPKNSEGYTVPNVSNNKSSFWDSYTAMPEVPVNKPEPISSTEYEPMFKTNTNVNTGSDYLNTIYSEQLEKMQDSINNDLVEYKKQQDALNDLNQRLASLEATDSFLDNNNLFAEGGYTVQKGDSLWKIAKKNNLNFQDLIAANSQLKDINNIQVGDVLNYPTNMKEALPTPSNNSTLSSNNNSLQNNDSSPSKPIEEYGAKDEFANKVQAGIPRFLDRNQADILEKKVGHVIERNEDGGAYAVTDDNGIIKGVNTSFELPIEDVSFLTKNTLGALHQAAMNGDNRAIVALNTYLASHIDNYFEDEEDGKNKEAIEHNKKMEKYFQDIGITRGHINDLAAYYNDPYLRKTMKGKIYFDENADVLRDIESKEHTAEKVEASIARMGLGILTHGASELLLTPSLRGLALITGNKTWRDIDLNTMIGSTVDNPYIASVLNLGQSMIGGKINPMALGQLGIAAGLEAGAVGLDLNGYDNGARALRGLEFAIAPRAGRRNLNWYGNMALAAALNEGTTFGLHAIDEITNNKYGDFEAMLTPTGRKLGSKPLSAAFNMAFKMSGGTGMNGSAQKNQSYSNNKLVAAAQRAWNYAKKPLREGLFHDTSIMQEKPATTENNNSNVENNNTSYSTMHNIKQTAKNFFNRRYTGITSSGDSSFQQHQGEGINADNFRAHAEIGFTVDGQAVKPTSTAQKIAAELGYIKSPEQITPIELNTHADEYRVGDRVLGGEITYKGNVDDAPMCTINKEWYKSMSQLQGDVTIVTLDPTSTYAVKGGPNAENRQYANYNAPEPPQGSKYHSFNMPATDNFMTLGITKDGENYVQYNAGNARCTIVETPDGKQFVRFDDTFETHARATQYNKLQQRMLQAKIEGGLPSNQQDAVSQVMSAVENSPASDKEVVVTFNTGNNKGKTITISKDQIAGTSGVPSKAKVQEVLKEVYDTNLNEYNNSVNSFKEKLNWVGEAQGNSVVYQTRWMPLEVAMRFLKTNKSKNGELSQKEVFMENLKKFKEVATTKL